MAYTTERVCAEVCSFAELKSRNFYVEMSQRRIRGVQKGGKFHMPTIRQMEAYNIDPHHFMHQFVLFNNRQWMDYEWMERQIAYMDRLNERDIHVIKAYTRGADELMNGYLRGLFTHTLQRTYRIKIQRLYDDPKNPDDYKSIFYYQHFDRTGRKTVDQEYFENMEEYTKKMIQEFATIIERAPRLSKRIKVFRGLKDCGFIPQGLQRNQSSRRMYFHNPEFVSTSFYLESAAHFMNNGSNPCMEELTIEPDTPCLCTGHFSEKRIEYEITLLNDIVKTLVVCRWKCLLIGNESYPDTPEEEHRPPTSDMECPLIARVAQYNVHPRTLIF